MIGYILLAMLGLVIALLIAAAINTFRIKLGPPPAGRGSGAGTPGKPAAGTDSARLDSLTAGGPLAITEEAAGLYGKKLAAMIRIPTISRHENEDLTEFRRFQRCLEELFPLVHRNLQKTDVSGNLLFRWKGKDPARLPILLMAHQDVVPAPPGSWTHPPFDGVISDGLLYGRGTLDCKCNIFTQLQAIEELLETGHVPPFDVYVEMSINEETGGEGAPLVAKHLKDKGIRLSLVMDEGGLPLDVPIKGMDRPYAVIGVVEKGYMDVKVTARSHGGHSSTPPRHTPVARLAEFIHEMEKKRPFRKVLQREVLEMFGAMAGSFPFGMRFLLGNLWLFKPLVMALLPRVSPFGEALMATTCTFTMCGGSDAANVIPAEAYVVANLRTSPHQNCEQSLAILRRKAERHDLTLEILLQRDASPCTDTRGEVYRQVADIIRTCFPGIGVAPYFVMGGTDARHFHTVTDNVLRFTPIRMTSAQLETCHGIDENVSLSALAEGVEFYKYFIDNWKG